MAAMRRRNPVCGEERVRESVNQRKSRSFSPLSSCPSLGPYRVNCRVTMTTVREAELTVLKGNRAAETYLQRAHLNQTDESPPQKQSSTQRAAPLSKPSCQRPGSRRADRLPSCRTSLQKKPGTMMRMIRRMRRKKSLSTAARSFLPSFCVWRNNT